MKAEDVDVLDNPISIVVGSNGDSYKLYRVRNEVKCDCPARKMCKHIKDFRHQEEVERSLTLLEANGFCQFTSAGCFGNVVDAMVRLRKEWV